jgi:adenylate cyclase
VAKALEEARADKLDENAALLAHHWEEAGEILLAARWHRRAAEWAGAHDVAEASRHWHRVRELMREVSDVPEAAELGAEACAQILNTGWRLGLSDEEKAAVFTEGKHWTERSGDLEASARLEESYATTRRLAGDFAASLAHTEEAERIAQQADNESLRTSVGWGLVYAWYNLGRLHEARERLEELIQQTREKPDLPWLSGTESLHTLCLWFRANLDFYMGDVREAGSMLEQAVQWARERGELENEGWALGIFGFIAMLTGEVELALPRCRRCLEIAEKIGSPFSRAWGLSMLSAVLIEAGEWAEAIDVAERALQLARERRTALEGEAWHLFRLAEAHLGAGDLARAGSFAEESVAVARRMGARTGECLAQRTLARVLMRREGSAAAKAIRRALDRADTLVDETGAKNFRPLIQLERAELARLEGVSRTRAHELREAHRLFTEMGATERARYVAAQLESLSA